MPQENELNLVKVFETGNPALMPLIESVLQDAGIDYVVPGAALQGAWGWGRPGITNGIGQFYVRAEDEAEARAVLAPLSE